MNNKLDLHGLSSLMNDTGSIINSYINWKKRINGCIEFKCDVIPFKGNFAFLAGVDEFIEYLENIKFTDIDINFLSKKFNFLPKEYFSGLKDLNFNDIEIYGLDNGSEFFCDQPLFILTGPLYKINLLIFPMTYLLGFSTLVCTNSVRMRLLAGQKMSLLEFGLRRAQGPNAALAASKYSYLGTFDSNSNVLSGFYYNIPVKGTCAHAYIMSYQHTNNHDTEIFNECLKIRNELNWTHTNISELVAFCSFCAIYKENSLLLVDTYNTIESGVKNAIIVSIALDKIGFSVRGIRLDSGDLPLLSKKAKQLFEEISKKYNIDSISNIKISASNDINEKSLKDFNSSGHCLDILGIGTNLVTCQLQPLLKFNVRQTNKKSKIFRIEDKYGKYVSEILSDESIPEIINLECSVRERSKVLYKNNQSFNEKSLKISRDDLINNLKNIEQMIILDKI